MQAFPVSHWETQQEQPWNLPGTGVHWDLYTQIEPFQNAVPVLVCHGKLE